ncbi:MAG: AAA family ATPase [Cellulosilyticum sp.]|nr:AAA family ATPase [Cellulosilyticum sp.]
MNSQNELNWTELNRSYQPSNLSFRTTNEVDCIEGLFHQEDAIETIEQGLQIDSTGYNLYICGVTNKEMENAIVDKVKEIAYKKQKPMAVGYIYNFDIPEEPNVIELISEDALQLKQDLEEFRAFIMNDIPILVNDEKVQEKKESIIAEFEKISERYFMDLTAQASQKNIQLTKTEEGIKFAPLNEKGENLSKEAFLKLSSVEQEQIMTDIHLIQEYMDDIVIALEKKENEYLQMYEEIGQEVILKEVSMIIKKLQGKYSQYSKLLNYFNGVAEEILDNLDLVVSFAEQNEEIEPKVKETIKQEVAQMVKKYDINLLGMPKGNYAPVINDIEDRRRELIGSILLDVENNSVQSSFLHIRSGLLNQANGGYLIVHMDELVAKPKGWKQLKSVLRTGKMYIEGNEEVGITLATAIRPQPIPVNVKVVLIGNDSLYEVLKNYDDEFTKLFKVKAVFNDEINISTHKVEQIAGVIKGLSEKEEIKPLTASGLLRLLEFGYRQMEHPSKISSDFDWMMDILREAQQHADTVIDKEHIEKCLRVRGKYVRRLKEKLDESLEDGTYLIDTKGAKIGQINGLAVYSIEDYSFGRPIRITATTYRGKQGIIDIENEAKLSGSIHTKGIHIITGFLGNQFAQDIPLSLNCNICFEQSYVGVDGDSASSAELYAILSSLAEVPIYQNIAVTGSVNQFGEIQPVGGINEKIEGFFQFCQKRGLSGKEGVVIPRKNMKELLLESEVVEAVKNHQFHIYAITDIWEGIEIMTGQQKEFIKKHVQEKLTIFNQ